MSNLKQSDIARLLENPSEDARAEMAERVAADFHDCVFNSEEVNLVTEIFEIMVEDASERVRRALAYHLCKSAHLPHALALKMANDVDAIAMPMLRYSEVLTDEDLIHIVRTSGEAKQLAIADRNTISESVVDSLIDEGTEKVVTRVFGNPGAQVSEQGFTRALDRFDDSDGVSSAITRRGLIPMAVAERLISRAAESLRRFMDSDDLVSADDRRT